MTAALLPLQARFQQHMLGSADASDLLAGSADRRALGLAIYANAYRLRLVEVLADAYAKTRVVLGTPAFEATARHYVAGHPPTTRSLRWFGADFAEHLATALPEQPDLAELAQLEWALRGAFDGPDSAVLGATDLAGVPAVAWASLRLIPVPTARLLRLQHNTVARWQALDDEAAPPAIEQGAVAVDWLVWRKDLQPHFRSLHPVEAGLLRALLDGAGFAQACEQVQAGTDEDCTARVGACLRQWLEEGVLGAVLIPLEAAR